MANTSGSRSDFITRQRNAATALLDTVDELVALRATWDTGMNTWLTDDDFQGENAGLFKADVAAGFTTLEALQALLAQGHRTNLEVLRK